MTLQDGFDLIRAGRFEEASNILRVVTNEDKLNHKAWNALGFALTKEGKFEEAENCFLNALNLQPDEVTYKKNLNVNRKKRETSRAQIGSKNVQKGGKPQVPLIVIILGLLFIFMIIGGLAVIYGINSDHTLEKGGDLPDLPATLGAEEKTQLILSQYNISITQGNTLMLQHNPMEAYYHFENATRADSKPLEAWTGMGYALLDLGKYDESTEAFNTALGIDPDYHSAQIGVQIALDSLQGTLSKTGENNSIQTDCSYCHENRNTSTYEAL